jgi:putative endonuclease
MTGSRDRSSRGTTAERQGQPDPSHDNVGPANATVFPTGLTNTSSQRTPRSSRTVSQTRHPGEHRGIRSRSHNHVIPANAGIHVQYLSMLKHYSVYLLANQRLGTLYVGSTSNLIQRIHQHKAGLADGFTKRYGIKMLVWFEMHESSLTMVSRERQLKEWKRQWKVDLIEKENAQWRDLYDDLLG